MVRFDIVRGAGVCCLMLGLLVAVVGGADTTMWVFVSGCILTLTSTAVAVVAFRAQTKSGHVPGERGATFSGLTYCDQCGLLIAADDRPDLKAGYKPCRTPRLTFRRGRLRLVSLPND